MFGLKNTVQEYNIQKIQFFKLALKERLENILAEVVALLVKPSLPTLEVCSSNPIIKYSAINDYN